MGLGQKEEIAYGREHVLWPFLLHITTAFRPKGSALYVRGCGCGVENEKIACMMQASRLNDALAGNKEKAMPSIETSRK